MRRRKTSGERSKKTASGSRRRRRPARVGRRRPKAIPDAIEAVPADVAEVEAMRRELERTLSRTGPPRWNANPDDVQRSVIQLVLTLVEFVRRLLERQAIRRMESRTLTKKETENIGLALMRLESTIQDIAAQFNIPPEELNLDLGPVGRLM